MKYLLTTKEGLNEFTKLQETPTVNSYLIHKDKEYKILKVINNTDFIELLLKLKTKPKSLVVKWS